MLSALSWIIKSFGFCKSCTTARVSCLIVLHCANSRCICSNHAGPRRSTDLPPVKHATATSQDCLHGAPPAARDSCYYDTSIQSGYTSLYPILSSHLAGEQQHAQAVAAAAEASTPQASTYQQLHVQTSTADHYAATHDSFRMLSNVMASRPVATQHSLRSPMRSIQPPSHPSIHSKLASGRKRAATAEPAAPQVVDQGRSDLFTAQVPYFNFPILQCSAATPPS